MIELRKICFDYNDAFSIKNISLKIEAGKILGLIGESGSGKSTLVKILAGTLEANSGEVLLENEKLPAPSKLLIKGHQKIKVVTQANSLFPNISVYENIAYNLRFFQEKYKTSRTDYLLKLFNISKLKDKLPRELSGGELQRVMIAKAIADEPKVLLLDEPFSNLDVIIKQKVLSELKKIISAEKIACVFVTHEITDAFGLVNELLILKNGKNIQKGKSEEIYNQPKSKYIAQLSGEGFWFEARKTFYRPENFILSSQGYYTSKVLSSKFKGFYFQIFFNHEGQEVFLRNSENIESGNEINYNLKEGLTF